MAMGILDIVGGVWAFIVEVVDVVAFKFMNLCAYIWSIF